MCRSCRERFSFQITPLGPLKTFVCQERKVCVPAALLARRCSPGLLVLFFFIRMHYIAPPLPSAGCNRQDQFSGQLALRYLPGESQICVSAKNEYKTLLQLHVQRGNNWSTTNCVIKSLHGLAQLY